MRNLKDCGIEWIGEIPVDWEVSRIKQLFSEVNDRCENGENYTLLSVSEYYGVSPKSERINVDDMLTHAETLDGYKICKENDLVMNIMLAWKRALGVSEYTGIVSPAYCIYRGRQNICAKYFHYLFRTDMYANLFKQYSTGIIDSRLRLYPDKFLALKCQVPPIDMQRRIADYLDRKCSQIDAIIARQQEVIEKLKAYKLSVITEAVTKGLNPDVPMKDSGVEWIGRIPGNWTKIKLKNICQFINGDRSSNYPSPNEYVNDGIPFLGADSLCGRYVDITQSKKITKEKYHSMGGAKIRKGDVLYTLRGSTIGKNAIATFNEGTVASSLMVIRPISLIPEYLLYWLNSEEEFQQRQSYINGSTAPNLSAENVGSFVMFLPSEVEQREIADYLDKKCAEIELVVLKNQMLADQLSRYKKSLIYEVVTGKKEV